MLPKLMYERLQETGADFAIVYPTVGLMALGTPIDEVRTELAETVRRTRERVLMEQLARRIIAGAQVTIFDDALNDSWKRYKRKERRSLE